MMVLACKDTATQAPVNGGTPVVEYSGVKGMDAEVAKYTNADWLYQNYFGEYGLPAELKPLMLPELQMVANGFALQFGRGENVKESIAHLDQAMQMLHYSGQFALGMQQMQAEYQRGVYDKPATGGHDERPAGVPVVIMDDATRASLEEAERLDAEYAQEQEALVKEFNLPYALPERVNKYVIYSPAMKGRSDKGRRKTNGSSGSGGRHQIHRSDWWEGDIIWSNGLNGIGHMGIVDAYYAGEGTLTDLPGFHPDWSHSGTGHTHSPQVIDANTGPGVRRHHDINVWANNYTRIEGLTVPGWWRHEWRRTNAVAYAESLIGVPYNWVVWNKEVTSRTYCSQLVWQAYKGQGVDLDRDGGLIVFPEDIRSHPGVQRFMASTI